MAWWSEHFHRIDYTSNLGGNDQANRTKNMMTDFINISEAESRVMEVLWQRAPQTSRTIVAALQVHRGWHEKTTRTLLNRLLGKDAVTVQKDGRCYLYSPKLHREDWRHKEARNFMDRVFSGNVAPLLAHLIRHEMIPAKAFVELRGLIDAIENQQFYRDLIASAGLTRDASLEGP